MKKLTKVLSLVLALALVLMSVNIVAVNANDEQHGSLTITINNDKPKHAYSAYRLFKGNGTGTTPDSDVREDEDKDEHYLANVAFDGALTGHTSALWNKLKDGPSEPKLDDYSETIGADFYKAIDNADDFTAENLAKFLNDKVKTQSKAARYFGYVLEEFFKDPSNAISAKNTTNSLSGNKYVISGLPEGYYIVVDDYSGDEDVESDYILELVGKDGAEISPKHQIPTVDKKVGTAEGGSVTQGAYNLGDSVPFIIKVSIPTNIASYQKYDFIITDTLSGFDTSDASKITSTVKAYYDKNGDGKIEADEEGTNLVPEHFKPSMSGNILTITHNELVGGQTVKEHWGDHAGQNIIFTYSAPLNGDLLNAGDDKTDGGRNNVTLKYSNDPVDGSQYGTATPTPETVNVYSLELQVLKVDENKQPLGGARFTLSKWDGSKFEALTGGKIESSITNSDPSKEAVHDKFIFAGLGDGYYELDESIVPDGYNTNGKIYLEVKTTKDVNENLTGVTVNKYNKWGTDKPEGDPDSLNPVDITKAITNGVFTITVQNDSGVELPETGGMGTKIFYTLGGVLVVGAVILLVVKRRMRAE